MPHTSVRVLATVAVAVLAFAAANACKRSAPSTAQPQPSTQVMVPPAQQAPFATTQTPSFAPAPQPIQPNQPMTAMPAYPQQPIQQQQQQQPMITTPSTPPSWMSQGQPIGGGPSNTMTFTGTLASGDQTLTSGEFMDPVNLNFNAGQAVRIRVHSNAFDPYLIVRTPSGQQLDNDDFAPGSTDAVIDLPGREAGSFRIVVTSYRPGETGPYTLTVEPLGGGAQQPMQQQPMQQLPMQQQQPVQQQPMQSQPMR